MSVNDLTRGSVVHQLVGYALPLILISAFQALYSIVDLIVVGQYVGSDGMIALTNAGQVVAFLSQIVIAITVGGNIMVGQSFGSGQDDSRKHAAGALCVLCILLAISFSILLFMFASPILLMLGGVSRDAVCYIQLSAIGFIPIFGYHALSAILRGIGDSRSPMYCIVVSTVINIMLDVAIVGGLGWGVIGAALATFMAQLIAFLLILVVCVLPNREFFGITREYLKLDWRRMGCILKLGIPVAIQQTIIAFSWLYVLYVINSYGGAIVAGYGVSAKIRDFCQLLVTAMMTGTATMIAQCLGAGDFNRVRRVLYTAMALDFGMTTVVILIVELCAPQIIGIFTADVLVIQAAVTNLRIEIMGQWFFSIFFIYHALAIGAGHTLFITCNSFLNCVIVRITLLSIFGHTWGITGVYWILMIATSVSILPGLIYERSNIWQRAKIETLQRQ